MTTPMVCSSRIVQSYRCGIWEENPEECVLTLDDFRSVPPAHWWDWLRLYVEVHLFASRHICTVVEEQMRYAGKVDQEVLKHLAAMRLARFQNRYEEIEDIEAHICSAEEKAEDLRKSCASVKKDHLVWRDMFARRYYALASELRSFELRSLDAHRSLAFAGRVVHPIPLIA